MGCSASNEPLTGATCAAQPHSDSQEDTEGSQMSLDYSLAIVWLYSTVDNDDTPENVPVLETIKILIAEAKKFKSFSSLVHLHALQKFIALQEHYMLNPKVKNLMMRASHACVNRKGTLFCT